MEVERHVLPEDGRVKPGGWGASPDANKWRVVNMRDEPLFKVVDSNDVDVADRFQVQANAEEFVMYHKFKQAECENQSNEEQKHSWDYMQQKCISKPVISGNGDVDELGIQKIYKDTTDQMKLQQSWYSKGDWSTDRRVVWRKGRITVKENYVEGTPTTSTNPHTLRVNILTTNPKANDRDFQGTQAKDWQIMAAREDSDGKKRGGWMVGPEDFRDTEISEYFKIVDTEGDENTHYTRGGAHGSGGYPGECRSCCIKQQIKTDVSPRAAKEYDHVDSPDHYAFNDLEPLFDLKSELGGELKGKLLGQKTCFYNLYDSSGKVSEVVMETYVDTGSKDLDKVDLSKQNWRKYAASRDNGSNWPNTRHGIDYVSGCNASSAHTMITWGGPVVTTRLDNSTKRFYLISVREITPPTA